MVTLGLTSVGLERKTVRLAPYDPHWPDVFAVEAMLLCAHLGIATFDVSHIGSTAVPGLEAKPIIDAMLGIHSLRAPPAFFAALSELGYELRPLDEVADRPLRMQQ